MVSNKGFPFDLVNVKWNKFELLAGDITIKDLLLNNGGCGIIKDPFVVHEVSKLDTNFFAFLNVVFVLFSSLFQLLRSNYFAQIVQSIGRHRTPEREGGLVHPVVCVGGDTRGSNCVFIVIV